MCRLRAPWSRSTHLLWSSDFAVSYWSCLITCVSLSDAVQTGRACVLRLIPTPTATPAVDDYWALTSLSFIMANRPAFCFPPYVFLRRSPPSLQTPHPRHVPPTMATGFIPLPARSRYACFVLLPSLLLSFSASERVI